MKRRYFIKRAGIGAGILAASAAIASESVRNNETIEKGQQAAKENVDKIKQRLQNAESKIDQLQVRQKKAIRAGFVLAGLVVGLDLSLLL